MLEMDIGFELIPTYFTDKSVTIIAYKCDIARNKIRLLFLQSALP